MSMTRSPASGPAEPPPRSVRVGHGRHDARSSHASTDVVDRAGVREAHVLVAALQVEVDTRRRGHTEFVQPSPAETRASRCRSRWSGAARGRTRRTRRRPARCRRCRRRRARRSAATVGPVALDVAVEFVGARRAPRAPPPGRRGGRRCTGSAGGARRCRPVRREPRPNRPATPSSTSTSRSC